MPCTGNYEEYLKKQALKKLDEQLAMGTSQLVYNQISGQVEITNWEGEERAGWCDGCAINAMKVQGGLGFQNAWGQLQQQYPFLIA